MSYNHMYTRQGEGGRFMSTRDQLEEIQRQADAVYKAKAQGLLDQIRDLCQTDKEYEDIWDALPDVNYRAMCEWLSAKLEEMKTIGQECTCFLPEMSCPACRAAAAKAENDSEEYPY